MIYILIAVWHLIGTFTLIAFTDTATWISKCTGWEFVNPYYVYKYCVDVNWFGAIMLALLCTIACPIGAVCYWFYKLCTVGR